MPRSYPSLDGCSIYGVGEGPRYTCLRIKGIHRAICWDERGKKKTEREGGREGSSGAFQDPFRRAMLEVVRHAHRQTGTRPGEPFLNQANAF